MKIVKTMFAGLCSKSVEPLGWPRRRRRQTSRNKTKFFAVLVGVAVLLFVASLLCPLLVPRLLLYAEYCCDRSAYRGVTPEEMDAIMQEQPRDAAGLHGMVSRWSPAKMPKKGSREWEWYLDSLESAAAHHAVDGNRWEIWLCSRFAEPLRKAARTQEPDLRPKIRHCSRFAEPLREAARTQDPDLRPKIHWYPDADPRDYRFMERVTARTRWQAAVEAASWSGGMAGTDYFILMDKNLRILGWAKAPNGGAAW